MSANMRRQEKTNAFDKNAILVLHADERTKCGYIKKDLTARLAPLVDEGKISLVPYINKGELEYSTSLCQNADELAKAPLSSVGLQETDIALEIRGKRSHARDPRLDWLFPARKKRKVQQQQRAQAATDRSSSPKALHSSNASRHSFTALFRDAYAVTQGATKMSAPEITTLVEELDGKPSGDVLSALFQASGWDPIALPLHPKPPGRQTKKMKTDLLPFQVCCRLAAFPTKRALIAAVESRIALDDLDGAPSTSKIAFRLTDTALGTQEGHCRSFLAHHRLSQR